MDKFFTNAFNSMNDEAKESFYKTIVRCVYYDAWICIV